MYATLRDFAAALETGGELRRIAAPVSPVEEIAAIADRVSRTPAPNAPSAAARRNDPRFFHLGGPALLFQNVEGSDLPVLINAFGSYRRVEMALGCGEGGVEAIAARLGELVKPQPPRSLAEALAKGRSLLPLLRIPPRCVKRAACQEIVLTGGAADLTRLPLIRCWPLDGDFAALGYPADLHEGIPGLGRGRDWDRLFRGRYITLGGVHTIHADDLPDRCGDRSGRDRRGARPRRSPASHNIGMYRVQLLGPRRMAMHWHLHHDGAAHWRSWKRLGKPMPVAIALGGESVLPYAATAPLPPGLSELLMAGFLNGRGIPMVMARTVPVRVPANAEIVVEGYVSHEAGEIGWDPRERGSEVGGQRSGVGGQGSAIGPGAVFEGPFGDHTGFYSLPDRYPILDVTAITMRRGAIYPTTIVGLPPQEDYYLGKATERLFLPLLRVLVPDIVDYDLPMFGAFHNCAVVSIRKSYPLHARRVMHAVWGAGQMSWTKTIIIVGDDVDVHDTPAVLRAVGEHCLPARDCELVRGPLDILDHAAPFLGAGPKIGLDATRKRGDAETSRPLDPLAAELCAAGPIGPVLGDAARASEARVRAIPGVLDARIPEPLGGWWLLIRAAKDRPGDGDRIVKALGEVPNDAPLPRWTIVLGPDADLADTDNALFHWVANTCPMRDRTLSRCGRRVAFDATPKKPGDQRHGLPVRPWPPILRVSEQTAARVDRRWSEYGLG